MTIERAFYGGGRGAGGRLALASVSRWRRASVVLGTLAVLSTSACVKNIPRPPDDIEEDGGGIDEMGGQAGIGAGGGSGGAGGLVPLDASVDVAVDQRRQDAPPSPPDLAPPPPDMAVPTCGGDGQACCPGNLCRNKGCCVAGRCAAHGMACPMGRMDRTCLNGSCGGCGGLADGVSQPCCEERACTAPKTYCTGTGGGTCQICGGAGQPCCPNSYCDANLACDATAMAPTGMCVSCGGKGAPCCTGQQACTTSSGVCTGGMCQ